MRSNTAIDPDIFKAVQNGLRQSPKKLPSWLLYDSEGDRIFQDIMRLPEYYPTRCEREILTTHSPSIRKYFAYDHSHFDLFELGAGDGSKTKIILDELFHADVPFTYKPVDVSENVLNVLQNRIRTEFPSVDIQPLCGRYETMIETFRNVPHRKVIMFLGANIGNYSIDDAGKFFQLFGNVLSKDDLLFVGFDLKKDPRIIQSAYDDSKGVTASFNINLLHRLNRELQANFDVTKFSHYPFYDPVSGCASSYLISNIKQEVYIRELNKVFTFDQFETLHTEISQKYDLTMIESLAKQSALEVVDILYDSRDFFCDVVFRNRVASGKRQL